MREAPLLTLTLTSFQPQQSVLILDSLNVFDMLHIADIFHPVVPLFTFFSLQQRCKAASLKSYLLECCKEHKAWKNNK